MLHSTLPRAFLPPGLGYLGGYYGEDAHLYSTTTSYVPCIEDPYARIPDQRVNFGNWEAGARSTSPIPLDLSFKPRETVANSNASGTEDAVEAIEVDDEEDRKCRETAHRKSLSIHGSYSNCEDFTSGIEESESEIRKSPSVHSYHSYDDSRGNVAFNRFSLLEDPRSPSIHGYNSYEEGLVTKKEVPDLRDIIRHKGLSPHDQSSSDLCSNERIIESHDPLTGHPKRLLTPSQSYHQLLLTPQHHLQGIHAPMTPPSTPSPPQCPRRRVREEPEETPPSLAIATSSDSTPRSSGNLADKPVQRPKKKHARRLKFDEDTSSPVSGTVILGPDEAVVTGDIDPAFNIVEVTEEARAELAKIENRLGPYQCKLCRLLHDDAFQLAQHRCSRIAHVEYRCPECDKRFSCPANLASHRRWHKPRIPSGENLNNGGQTPSNSTTQATTATIPTNSKDQDITRTRCDAKFTRPAALRKHLATQHPETNNNLSITNNNNNNSNDNISTFEDISNPITGKTTLCVPASMNLGNASHSNEIP